MDLARSSVKVFFARITGLAVSFIGIAYFARELGAAEMGIFFLFQAIVQISAIPADLGIRGALTKRMSEGENPSKILTTAFILKLIPLLIASLILFIFRSEINEYIGSAITVYIIIALFVREYYQLSLRILDGELRVGDTAILHVAYEFIWVGLALILVKYNYDAESMIIGTITAHFVVFFWGIKRRRTPFGSPSKIHAISLFDYSKYNFISGISGRFYSWTDVLIIGLFLSQAHVGAYEIAWQVSSIVLLFSGTLATSIFPQVSQWEKEGARDRIEDLVTEALIPSVVFVIPAFFGVVLLSEEILGIVFGSEYTIAAGALILLMVDKVFQAVQVIIGRTLQAIDRPDQAARASLAAIVSNVGLNIIFVWKFGLVGAAVATVTSSLLNDLLHMYYLNENITIHIEWSDILWCFLSSIVMFVVIFGVKSVVNINTLLELLVVILIGVLLYTPILILNESVRLKIYNYAWPFDWYPSLSKNIEYRN